jgi:pyruvate,water dikinase
MAGSGQVTSAEHGYRLFDLAAAAAHDPAARDYLEATPRDPHGWRQLSDGSPFRVELERFLAEFGHRGIYELELANPRWNEDPSYLLEQVRSLLAAGRTERPQAAARDTRAAAEAEVRRRTRLLRPLVRRLAEKAREGFALREAGKSAMVALWEPLRGLGLEASRRMVNLGVLDAVDDLFYFSWMDVELLCRWEWIGPGAKSLVADRKAQATAWERQTPPDVIFGEAGGRAGNRPELPPASPRQGGTVLTGLAVAAGRATGPARIIRHPLDGGRLRPGDVLVAPSTDPAWTPLFLRAAAVVMEVGGYLSHGAIVAREYGLPAVVNIAGLLDAIREGQLLTVDGHTGEVTLGNEPSA